MLVVGWLTRGSAFILKGLLNLGLGAELSDFEASVVSSNDASQLSYNRVVFWFVHQGNVCVLLEEIKTQSAWSEVVIASCKAVKILTFIYTQTSIVLCKLY